MSRTRSLFFSVSLFVFLLFFSSTSWGDLKQADQLFEQAMKLFEQKKYMAAMPLFGRSMGELPSGKAFGRRARSLYYIGLCYHRMKKYEKHAVAAWRRFLLEVKKIPSAAKRATWQAESQMVKAVIARYEAPSSRRKTNVRKRSKMISLPRTTKIDPSHPDPEGFLNRSQPSSRKQPHLFPLRPKPKKTKRSSNTLQTTAVILIVSGALAGLGGVGLLAYREELVKERDALLKQEPSVELTTEVVKKQNSVAIMSTVGMSVLVGGIGVAVIGYFVYVGSRRYRHMRHYKRRYSLARKKPAKHGLVLFSTVEKAF